MMNNKIDGCDYAEERIDELLQNNKDKNILQQASQVDVSLYLPDDILVKVDIASMACGLEVRAPLLDHRIVEFCVNLPVDMKYHNGTGKYLLKELAYELLPEDIMKRPKQGFGVPVSEWLRSELIEFSNHALLEAGEVFYKIFDYSAVEHLLIEHQRGVKDNGTKLWSLICFSYWLNSLSKTPVVN